MPLTYDTESSDTLHTLIKKVDAILAVNTESLNFIKSRKGQKVILKYKYVLCAQEASMKKRKVLDGNDKLSNVRESNDEELLDIVKKQVTKSVNDVILAWRYQGDPLIREPIAFGNFLGLHLERYEDLIYLNDSFMQLSRKYARVFTDQPETRAAIRVLLNNVEKLQVGIGQIHAQVLDANDPLEVNERVGDRIKAMSKELKLLQQDIPGLEVKCNIPQTQKDFDEKWKKPPSFVNFSKVSRKATFLNEESGGIPVLQNYSVHGKQYLASAQANGDISLWDLERVAKVKTLTGHSDGVYALASYHMKGLQMLASGGFDKTIKIWNMENMSLTKIMNDRDVDVLSMEVVKTNKQTILIVGCVDGRIKMHDLEDYGSMGDLMGHSKSIRCLLAYQLHDEYYLASASDDCLIKIWSLNDNRLIATLKGHEFGIKKLMLTKINDTPTLISLDFDGGIQIWDLEDKSCIRRFQIAECWHFDLIHYNDEPCLLCAGKKLIICNLSGHIVRTVDSDFPSIWLIKVFMKGDKSSLALVNAKKNIELWTE